MSTPSLGTSIVCHDDHYFLPQVIESAKPAGPVVVFISRLAWNGTEGDWQTCASIASAAGAEVVLGTYPNESLHRRTALKEMAKRGFTHSLLLDADEILEPKLLDKLVRIASSEIAEQVCVHMDTYFKSTEYVVRPREALTPIVLVDLRTVRHRHIRDYTGGTRMVLGPDYGVMHHLSYCGGDARIQRKIETWGHRAEVLPGWYQNRWLAWDDNRLLQDLHPTHPPAYKRVERIVPPEILKGIPLEVRPVIEVGANWPKVSIVIPLHGGEEDIRFCLESLAVFTDLIHEVIVVDDCSPDRAPCVAEGFDFVTLISNETNLGFAATCNHGEEICTGDIVLYLNSDTVVPRSGLIRLIESLLVSPIIAAAGPVSNNTGHHQQIESTYQSLETMPLFADDLADSDLDDRDVDMLVGFALAVKRSVLKEVGGFDTCFGIGMFEDNDLCYRIRRAGYRLVLSSRAFVHHAGSKSLSRRKEHPAVLLTRNHGIYLQKWKADLETGYASHLSGTSNEPIRFDPSRKPEELDRKIRKLARRAGITLCMIVKNEERVLRDCLESVQGAFVHTVIVDTGSSDKTMEIAQEFGVELHQMDWPESFSLARNESLKYAKSPWIFWMDADDTLDRLSILAMLEAATQAAGRKVCFVIPVRFVEEGPNAGTQVDHVKLFPNLPGVAFDGHIHEQVLPSLRNLGVEAALLRNAVVRHSGYDTSVEGQARKREREKVLLKKDYDEEPTHPFRLFNLGMTDHFTAEHETAIQWLEQSIQNSKPNESHVKKAYALMGISKRELGDLDGALAILDEGLSLTPTDPELLFHSGSVLTQMTRLPEAKTRYLQIDEQMPPEFSSFDIGILTFKRYHNLGTVCIAMGNYPEAREWWRKALARARRTSPCQHTNSLALHSLPTISGPRRRL